MSRCVFYCFVCLVFVIQHIHVIKIKYYKLENIIIIIRKKKMSPCCGVCLLIRHLLDPHMEWDAVETNCQVRRLGLPGVLVPIIIKKLERSLISNPQTKKGVDKGGWMFNHSQLHPNCITIFIVAKCLAIVRAVRWLKTSIKIRCRPEAFWSLPHSKWVVGW